MDQVFPASWLESYQAAHEGMPLVQRIEFDPAEYEFAHESICAYSLIQYLHQYEGVPFGQIAVLYRTRKVASGLSQVLDDCNIPYQYNSKESFYERKAIAKILSFLRLLINPHDNLSFKQVMSLDALDPSLSKEDLLKLIKLAISRHLSLYAMFSQLKGSGAEKYFGKNIKFCQYLDEWRSALHTHTDKLSDFVLQYVQSLCSVYHVVEQVEQVEQEDAVGQKGDIKKLINKIAQFERQDDFSSEQSVVQFSTEDLLRAFLEHTSFSANGELEQSEDDEEQRVNLMTIHASKGLEFEAVIVLGCQEGVFPNPAYPYDIEEERRVAYVAFTRAKRFLFALYAERTQLGTLDKETLVDQTSFAELKLIKCEVTIQYL